MTVTARLSHFLLCTIVSLAVLSLPAPAATADCAKDSKGEVYCGGGRCIADSKGAIWCSRAYKGGAERTRDGSVVCGKGQCAKDSRGRVFCSPEMDGAVLIDSSGRVRCYGRCERATAAQCERSLAGSSG